MRQAQTRIDNAISLVSFASEDRGMVRKFPGCDGKPPRHPLPASDEQIHTEPRQDLMSSLKTGRPTQYNGRGMAIITVGRTRLQTEWGE